MTGVIKTIKADKGYGFITIEGRDKELFFHAQQVVGGEDAFRELKEGQTVSFEENLSGPKGPAAEQVQAAQ